MVSNQQTADTQEVEEQSTVLVDSIESAQLQPEQHEAGAEEIVKLKDVKQIIVYLAKEFPNCFTSEGEAKPLKIGIFKELAERVEPEGVVSRTQLRQALRRYTSSWRYLKSIAKGGVRIDLDGKPGDKVEQDHIDHAAKALEESKAKFEASRKTLKDKKIYKKSQKETGENSSKQTKFNNSKQRAAGKSYVTSKAGGSKSGKSARKQPEKKAPAVELSPLTDQLNKPGTQVMVKLGQSPVPGVIREVAKGVIHVELNSGMVVKTTFENIFVA
jgi:ProP effector